MGQYLSLVPGLYRFLYLSNSSVYDERCGKIAADQSGEQILFLDEAKTRHKLHVEQWSKNVGIGIPKDVESNILQLADLHEVKVAVVPCCGFVDSLYHTLFLL